MLLRDRIKLGTIPTVCKLAARAGASWSSLSERFRREAVLAQTQELFRQPCELERFDGDALDILFMPYLGCFQGNNMIQAMLGRLLQARGHRVRFLVADIDLPICETTDISTHQRRDSICSYNQEHLKRFLAATGMETVLVSDILGADPLSLATDLSKAEKWKPFVDSMLLRYFKVGILDAQCPLLAEMTRRAQQAALISEAVGEGVAALNPDRVIMSHGTYTTRGPARVVLNEANVPLLTISRGKIAQTQKFNWRTASDWWSVDDTWEAVKDTPLTPAAESLINQYLMSRRRHDKDVMVYNFSGEEDREKTLDKLGLNADKPVYTLFTNVLWDAASAQREIAFDNPIQWVTDTIAWFADHQDKSLVVRIHPAETVIGTMQPMKSLIEAKVPQLPANVRLLEPDAPFNSWSLLKITNLGLVHTSTVGLELALEGIPCACVSETHFRGKGFTIDVESNDDYFRLLDEGPGAFDQEHVIDLAKRYSYLLFMRYQIPLPFFNPETHLAIHSFKSTKWNSIVQAPQIKLIIDSIEQQREQVVMSDELAAKLHGEESR